MFKTEYELYVSQIAKFRERVRLAIYSGETELNCVVARTAQPVPFDRRLELEYRPIFRGEAWGETWESAWFHVTGTVPRSFAGREVALLFDAGGESLIFSPDGCPLYGLTGGSVFSEDFRKNRYVFLPRAKGGEKVDFWIEAAANQLFGVHLDQTHDRTAYPCGYFVGVLNGARIAVFDRELWALHLDLEVLDDLAQNLTDYRKYKYTRILSDAANVYADDPANAAKAREVLKRIFAFHAQDSAPTVHAVGHAHIDTAWLWPVRETVRKCARTFASQIALIEKYPDYVFGASAARHYAFVKERYPKLYAKIKKAVKAGRWELQGGMWVEADCNLVSGESMIRQFLHGKNFFRDEFGVEVRNLWLPDVFGYSASMPQILRRSGCDFFLTQKISWSLFNRFPYQTFRWKGIDGSTVLTHFPPENTYNSTAEPGLLIKAQNEFPEGDKLSDFMSLYGIGDGGGGPAEEFVERGLRMRDLEGCPKFKFDRADRFFDEAAKAAAELPEWNGELYLELHRGTLTTQSRIKRGNRKLEQLFTATEFLLSLLPLRDYPAKPMDAAWKKFLTNQFHDILPGSSITMVYQVAEHEYAELEAFCRRMQARAAKKLFVQDTDAAVVLNTLSYDVSAALELPESWDGFAVTDETGKNLPVQSENGTPVVLVPLKRSSLAVIRKGKKRRKSSAAVPAKDRELVLENECVRCEFSPAGELLRAYDKRFGCEILKPGEKGNVLSLYSDDPHRYDAWDIDIYYQKQCVGRPVPVAAEKTFAGKVRSVLEFELKIGDSTIRQQVVLEAGSARLDFRTAVAWNESRKMLRTAFPVNVFASEAAFDIQYGFIRRPMHDNTTWDVAKFEVCGQRYADISGDSWGVALLNDCKYGHRVKDGVIDLALLRSPKHPDRFADLGYHVFTYSLLPHGGSLIHSEVMKQAALLNRPPELFRGFATDVRVPFSVGSDSVTLEVVKRAEKDNCLVFRMVETHGEPASAHLRWDVPGAELVETDMLEWKDAQPIPRSGDGFDLTFAPFEIKTFKGIVRTKAGRRRS